VRRPLPDAYELDDDSTRIDRAAVHAYLCGESYWAAGRPRDVMDELVATAARVVGLYDRAGRQVGFARVVTDYATFAWLADVFVLEEHRGRGLSKWLMEVILSHPELQGFRRWVLATKDAHELYRKFGFIDLHRPERWMERPDPSMKESPDYWGPR